MTEDEPIGVGDSALGSLFEHVRDAILLLEEGGLGDCNPAALSLFGANELFGGLEVELILVECCGDELLKGIAVGLLIDVLPHGLHEQGSSVGPHEVGDGIQSLDKILRGLEMNAAGFVSTHLTSISRTSLPKSLGTSVVPQHTYPTDLRHLTRARSPDRILRNVASRRHPWLWCRARR